MIPFDMLGMVYYYYAIVTLSPRAVFQIFDFRKCRDLEIRVIGHSRSSELTRVDPPPMTFY